MPRVTFLFFICLAVNFDSWVSATNILFISAIPSPSHHGFNKELALALANKGHNVTMVTNDKEAEKNKHFTAIEFEGVYDDLHETYDIATFIKMSTVESVMTMYEWSIYVCSANFKSKGMKQLLEYPKDFKFDLIIYDPTVGQCLYPLIDRFNKPPVVAITAFLLPHYLSNAMGNHVYPSYYPHYNLQATNHMAFFDRVKSYLVTYGETFYRNYWFGRKSDEISKEFFGDGIRPMLEVERSFSILLANTDPILDYPVTLPPNIIPIGGMHIRPAKPLPKDLLQIMDEAKNGVILFSLGTNLQSQFLPDSMKQELINGLSKLKETVLWKYEGKIENLPKNVITRKWLPQRDILGHPNCKLFISHGGGLSTQEAIYFGVPIVGMPGFADQHKNIHKFVNKGFGKKLDFTDVTSSSIYESVREVLDNPIYSKNIKEASSKYKDQPQTPLERAIFWTEYVLRHGDAKDLELPARDMCFFQTTNLDVVGFLLSVVFLEVFIVYKFIKYCFCSSQKRTQKIKKQ